MSSNNHLLSIEKLDGDNYATWKLDMKMVLMNLELWGIVDGSEPCPNDAEDALSWAKKDGKALSTIYLSTKRSEKNDLSECKTSAEAWKKLSNVYEKKGLQTQILLSRNFLNSKYLETDTMKSYISRVMAIVEQMNAIGAKVGDKEIAFTLLRGLPKSYDSLIMSLESREDELTTEYVRKRLMEEEDRRKEDHAESSNTQESAFISKGPRVTRTEQHKGRGRGNNFSCFHCGKKGHKIADCYKRISEEKSKARRATTESSSSRDSGFIAALSASSADDPESWCIDSGATRHLCSRREWFQEYKSIEPKKIYMADDRIIKAEGEGIIQVNLETDGGTYSGHFQDVLYVPELEGNLLSVSKIASKGRKIIFSEKDCQVIDKNGEVSAKGLNVGGLYKLSAKVIPPSQVKAAKASSSKSDLELWHRRFGHLNEQAIKSLHSKGLVKGLDIEGNEDMGLCKGCIYGKQHQEPFPQSGAKRATEILEIIHSDLCGPMRQPSIKGALYFLTFIDDKSRKTFVYFLKSKGEVLEKFKEFKALVENQTGKRIKTLRSDNGGEYSSRRFSDFLKASGIHHQKTVPYTPQQNGVAERANRTIVEKARSMIHGANLHDELWAEAVWTAVHLKNISPTSAVHEMTPAEAWSGKKPSVEYLRAFGCKAYAHVPHHLRGKFDQKSKELIFVGYSSESKGYRLYDPKSKAVRVYRDVIFDEKQEYNTDSVTIEVQSKPEGTDNKSSTTASIETSTDEECKDEDDEVEEEEHHEESSNDNLGHESDHTIDDASESSVIGLNSEEPAKHLRRSTREKRPPERLGDYVRKAVVGDEPSSFGEAMEGPNASEWEKSTREEYESIMKNKTWTLVDLPPERKAIGCKWVFKVKYDAQGNVERYKSRLVAKGYSQTEGVDFNETFAPVAKFNSIRLLIALAAQYDLELHQMDVKTAFLNGDLEEEIYMEQPEGFILPGNENKVCKLQRSIYGLKQAGRSWYKKIDNFFLKQGFQRTHADCCVYQRNKEGSILTVAIYVDDLLILGSNLNSVNDLKAELSKRFEMKDLGEAHYCLGIEIARDRRKGSIKISQEKYVENILKRFHMSDCKPIGTPLDAGVKLSKNDDPGSQGDEEVKDKPYKSAVGSLMYAMLGTRPDISFAVGVVSRFSSNPTIHHWKAVKRIFRYLKGTISHGIEYERDGKALVGYSDADWAGDTNDRKSTTGYTFILAGGAVTWSSKKQPTVALSTTEAEYMALTQASKEAVWIKRLLEELGTHHSGAVTINGDNQGSLSLARNAVFHARSKHIDIQHHFIREKVERNEIALEYCATKDMIADILTKALSKEQHQRLTKKLGLK
jgi:hypothetical protein